MEIWKDIPGYENYYQVSNYGRVKSLPRTIIDKRGVLIPVKGKVSYGTKGRVGYPVINLYKNNHNQPVNIHRLVAEAFIERPEHLTQVNHKDSNRANNHVDNLEWVTPKGNTQHAVIFGNMRPEKHPRSKMVYVRVSGCLFRFKSVTQAGRVLSIRSSSISHAISKGRSIHSLNPYFIKENL